MKPRVAWLMLAPVLIIYILIFIVPMIMAVRLSLFQTDYIHWAYVGFSNYVMAVKDKYFQKAFINSFIIVGMILPAQVFLSYKAASLLSEFKERTRSVIRFILYAPSLASGIIISLVWGMILSRDGIFNQMLGSLGLPAVSWLYQVWPARIAVAIVMVTSNLGGVTVIFTMYMHSISPELKDAAMIDGANLRQYKRYILLPLMLPILFLVILLCIVGNMQLFEVLYMLMGEGGPEGSTASPAYEIFLTAFMFGRPGVGAVKGLILMVVIGFMLLVKQRLEKLFIK